MTGSPLSYLSSAGPAAKPLTQLAWGLGGISIAVTVIVTLALVAGIWRRRPPAPAGAFALEPGASPNAGLAWIYVGLGLSVPVLAACTVWTLFVLGQVMHPASKPQLTLEVTAHQWWWEVRYMDPVAGRVFTTANEIHIPTGQPVRVVLSSPDVIHSFWVPKLAGKMDVIPGVTNVTWIQASAPGRYRGQCAEFCGLQHARMAFFVTAESPAEFNAWRDRQLAPPAAPTDATVAQGSELFAAHCASCHTVSGTPAGAIVGPDLSHIAGRATLAAGTIPNDAAHLSAWISDPDAIKPGVLMPKAPLSAADRAKVVAYLQSLT
ncbi:cytochrome c oxidase subunit II [Caulobacter sp. KR2-114]|uniref:cytochrome c oxidase subunit II n=1 Tax=Caulobacter sp. KR2-114 TaxID=3400912 RepID=UPI003C0BC317